jgi:hypothetical protein
MEVQPWDAAAPQVGERHDPGLPKLGQQAGHEPRQGESDTLYTCTVKNSTQVYFIQCSIFVELFRDV